MLTFVAILHIIVSIVLIVLVLVQDSKSGGGVGGAFGGGANSLLGPTGASSLAAKLTRGTAIIFALTCVALTYLSTQKSSSVIDLQSPAPITMPATDAAATTTTPAADAAAAPAATAAPTETK